MDKREAMNVLETERLLRKLIHGRGTLASETRKLAARLHTALLYEWGCNHCGLSEASARAIIGKDKPR